MLKFLTSLGFLYLFCIGTLLAYGFIYYRNFKRGLHRRPIFPVVFLLISGACIAFLWINFNPSLKLRTFSNLDHHFLRHDGFEVARQIELGKTDTTNYENQSFNRFRFSKSDGVITLQAGYSEDPLYLRNGDHYQVISQTFPATGHSITYGRNTMRFLLRVIDDNQVELQVGDSVFNRTFDIKRGLSAWNIFRNDDRFINTVFFHDPLLMEGLMNILLVRDHVNRNGGQELRFFISGKLFAAGSSTRYDEEEIKPDKLAFQTNLDDGAEIAWGIGFIENNRNQFKIRNAGGEKFIVAPRYPVSYPLTGESRGDFTMQRVSKFLVADHSYLQTIPSVFKEGFLFPFFETQHDADFAPVLLSYNKNASGKPLDLSVSGMDAKKVKGEVQQEHLSLPARSGDFTWMFSIQNTFDWDFGSRTLQSRTWQWIIFGSLALFSLVVLLASVFHPSRNQRWVWQLLACITLVLLTTRFFLYWRYKTFPPFEGMDLPSQQQLQSLSNFGVIVGSAIVLSLVFGINLLNLLFRGTRQSRFSFGLFTNRMQQYRHSSLLKKRATFFVGWGLLLMGCGAVVVINNFDAGTSRHVAVVLIFTYFLFLHWSYKHSPLVATVDNSWWRVKTGTWLNLLVNNPVKVLLSGSLLVLFVFIDIGFAVVFLNFLIFNEAFLCLNYSIAGLSTGSKKNARLFGFAGSAYFLVFIVNLLFAPYIFRFILDMPDYMYWIMYFFVSVMIAYVLLRLFVQMSLSKMRLVALSISILLFALASLLLPKERILEKASMTKYRIDVLTTPVDEAITAAYTEGKTYEPVIRAAQNQWFINTFIEAKNNPGVSGPGFQLLPHAPQNKGAKYNAQATDLVASRFLLAEHGTNSVLLFVVLLLLPVLMIASFYKLYPDFTNRANNNYPVITTGFSIINYLLVTALLVVLAATGRYIFFGQDLPFASILSKQSILFPAVLIVFILLLFRQVPQEYYANRYKLVPGIVVFFLLGSLLFFVKPLYNTSKSFTVANLSKEMDDFIQVNLQPLVDYIDTSAASQRFSFSKKDQLFTDSLKKMLAVEAAPGTNPFFLHELKSYSRSGFTRHLNQRQMLYLDISAGRPRLAVNENFFRVDPPPHLQEMWKGNVYGDTSVYNIALWDAANGQVITRRLNTFDSDASPQLNAMIKFTVNNEQELRLVNTSAATLYVDNGSVRTLLQPHGSYQLSNPSRLRITDSAQSIEQVLSVEPDAFMKNYYVNGSRFYSYPMGPSFIWARNFSEAIASDYASSNDRARNAFISLDYTLMDSISRMIHQSIRADTSYKKGAEYAVCIADNYGRIIALTDYIKGFKRPDPNDKAAFNKTLRGEGGYISQSLLRKQIGNLNLLRLNPGPGSTFKPIVFSAIASQLDWNWDDFSAMGFSEKQTYYGGERVPEYDFEKDNGLIRTVSDYLKYSDNYYHSNVLLLGSYPKQDPARLLSQFFIKEKPGAGVHWPYFTYTGKQYWLSGFQNWPGYEKGKADFGTDSSFTSIGLMNNYGIYTHETGQGFDMFSSPYDSLLFRNGYRKSGFVLPEYGLFDQRGDKVNHRIPYDLFISCFRGHVKGSSQVMVPPVKMTEAFGKMISQNRSYALTLNPYAEEPSFSAFDVDAGIPYSNYLGIMREKVFTGMRAALFQGTAVRLGSMLKNGAPYYYYAKTGTTGDDQSNSKSKLLSLVISKKDITHADFNFRKNTFYTIYFTSQEGPAKQNEELQAAIIRLLESSYAFNRNMRNDKK